MNLEVFESKRIEIQEIDFDTKIEFSYDSLPEISESIETENIYCELRQRFVSYGLIDNLIIHLSKNNSISLGLWIVAAYFQRKHKKYVLRLSNENSVIKEIWIDFRGDKHYSISNLPVYSDTQSIQLTPTKFVWTANSVEKFANECSFYFNQKISLYVTNATEDYFTMEQFYKRDVLIGFGEIGGGCLAAEFFLNLGLKQSDVNYEYIKYENSKNLADENSCEIRAELLFEQNQEKIISENN